MQKANLVLSLVMGKYTGFEFAQRVGEHKVRLHMHQAKGYPRTLETEFPGNCVPIQSLGTSY
ncbi:MAG: hypothetical protein DWB56_07705 [Candidatus Jettenia sp.]|nr:MAG: hypothetical protein EDM77_04700 [Candidatus Jettenia sp. AMX1]MBC6928831.1 hypothetical protein [Candidatus Jettenia sp.]MCE7881044.1 hypothetical protein [Candidatus Jettenia sp. AMX1]MCQ3927925.1 hypothetical protein [Candidatus Jettenia sp.]